MHNNFDQFSQSFDNSLKQMGVEPDALAKLFEDSLPADTLSKFEDAFTKLSEMTKDLVNTSVLPGLSLIDDAGAARAPMRAPESRQQSPQADSNTGTLPIEQFSTVAKQMFGKIDGNHDGYLSSNELGKAVNDKSLTGTEAQVTAALYNNRGNLEELSNDEWGDENNGVTKADLDKFNDLLKHTSDQGFNNTAEGKLVDSVSRIMDRTNAAQRSHVSGDLFLDAAHPTQCIVPDAIGQGTTGNCYYEAVAASMANSTGGKEQIAKMIQDNHDGTFTVTFPGDRKHPITVDAPTQQEMGLFNRGGQYGTWSNVLEKAFGEYEQQNSRWSRNGETSQEGADGGWPEKVMKLMTGKDADVDWTNWHYSETTAQKMKDALKDGRAVTCGFVQHRLDTTDKTDSGFSKSHVLSVIGFDSTGPDGGTVKIRNPWGGPNGTTDGTIDISLKQFFKDFNTVTYEGK